MNQCPVCRVGELQAECVETWMKKAGQWVLLKSVPAKKCDSCGDTTFSQEVAKRLSEILAPGSSVVATGSRLYPEYDLRTMDAGRAVVGPSRAGARLPG